MKRVAIGAMAMMVSLLAVTLVAQAQNALATGEYLEPLPMSKDVATKQNRQRVQAAYSKVVRGLTGFDNQGRTDVQTWIEGYIVPAMTSPDFYHEIGENRRDLTKDLQAAKSPELHSFMVELLFSQMRPLVEDNYPPPTRVNAMLLISELNQVEIGSGVEMFTPLPEALPYLRQQLNDPNQIDGVRLVALAGINRHVESQWWAQQPPNADWIDGIRQDMLAIINEIQPPAGRSPEAHAWFRARAADTLGSLCGWAPTAESFEALAAILADPEAPISLRCRAAYALGRFDYKKLPQAGDVNLEELTGNIAGLLADACKTEIDWIDKERDEARAGGVSPLGGSGMAGMSGMSPGGMSGMSGMAMPGGSGGSGMSSMPFSQGGRRGSARGGDDGGGNTRSGGTAGSSALGGATGAAGAGRRAQTDGVPVYIVDGARRRLLYELTCVDSSVSGPSKKADFKGLKELAANNDDVLSNLDAIEQEVEKLGTALRKEDYRLTELLKDVRSSMQKLDRMRPQPVEEQSELPSEEASEIPTADELPATEAAPSDEVPANGGDAEAPAEESGEPQSSDVPG